MGYDFLIRKDNFGGTLFDKNKGKRFYLNKKELEDFLEKRVLPKDIVLSCDNLDNFRLVDLSSESDKFAFADTVFIELTRSCNLRCKHCLNNSGLSMEGQLTKEEVLNLITNLADAGIQEVRLTGGEPLLFDGLFDCIKHSCELGLRTSLGTNGTLLTAEVAKKLREAGINNVVVSLDGLKEIHDSIRGEGAFEKSMQGINNLLNENIDVRVNSVIMKNNIEEVILLAKELNQKGVKLFIRRFVESGRGKNLPNMALTAEQYQKVKERLKSELEQNVQGHNLKNDIGTNSRIELGFEISSCRAGQRSFDITPNGEIYPCGFLAAQDYESLGNIRDIKDWRKFWDELQKSEKLNGLRKDMTEYNKHNQEKITCLAAFYAKTMSEKE